MKAAASDLADVWIALQDKHPSAVVAVGYVIIIFGLPVIFITLPALIRTRNGLPLISARRGFWYALVLGWMFLIVWASEYDKPLQSAKLVANGKLPYDGLGGSTGLLFGWLIMLVGAVPALTLRAMIRAIQTRAVLRTGGS